MSSATYKHCRACGEPIHESQLMRVAGETFHWRCCPSARKITAQSTLEPNSDEVICPNCVHQFRAIPENVQTELATLRAALAERQAAIDALVECRDGFDSYSTDEWYSGVRAEGHRRLVKRNDLAWSTARALATKEPQPAAKDQ